MSISRIKVRGSVRYALAWLAVGWLVLMIAWALGLWQAAFVAVLCTVWGIGRDLVKEGYFHPVLVFCFFALLIALINMAWMAAFMDGFLPFFAHDEYINANSMFIIAREHLVLFTATYAGYLLVRGTGRRQFEYVVPRKSPEDGLWLVFYLTGVLALIALIANSGGLLEALDNLADRSERAAGWGSLVLLQYFAYIGALLWFKKNIARPALQRYGGLVALSAPMLLSGSRTGILVALIAAGYMDERTGRRISLKAIALSGLALSAFFTVYQSFRSQPNFDILLSIYGMPTAVYKDLSMGAGYVVALQQGIVDSEIRPGVFWLILNPFVPSEIRGSVNLPESPNSVFTQHVFPWVTDTTFSMGLIGEAGYVLSPALSFLPYLAIGLFLAWVGSFGWKRSLLIAAVVAGGAVRVAKGGITGGGGEMLMLVAPVVGVYLVTMILYGAKKQKLSQPTNG